MRCSLVVLVLAALAAPFFCATLAQIDGPASPSAASGGADSSSPAPTKTQAGPQSVPTFTPTETVKPLIAPTFTSSDFTDSSTGGAADSVRGSMLSYASIGAAAVVVAAVAFV